MSRTVLVLALLATLAGCTPTYLADRGRDAVDIFTASVGMGYGAKVRVGPGQAGFLLYEEFYGLRSGVIVRENEGYIGPTEVVSPVPVPSESCKLPNLTTAFDNFYPPNTCAEARGKCYDSRTQVVPFVILSDAAYHYPQVEIVLGIVGCVRLGFNPGELLDFVLGWTTLDLLGDDSAAAKRREKAPAP